MQYTACIHVQKSYHVDVCFYLSVRKVVCRPWQHRRLHGIAPYVACKSQRSRVLEFLGLWSSVALGAEMCSAVRREATLAQLICRWADPSVGCLHGPAVLRSVWDHSWSWANSLFALFVLLLDGCCLGLCRTARVKRVDVVQRAWRIQYD